MFVFLSPHEKHSLKWCAGNKEKKKNSLLLGRVCVFSGLNWTKLLKYVLEHAKKVTIGNIYIFLAHNWKPGKFFRSWFQSMVQNIHVSAPSSIASQRRCGFQNSKNRKVIKNISCNSTAGNFTMIKIHKNVVDAGLRNGWNTGWYRGDVLVVNIILYANVQNQSWLLKFGI